MAAQPVERTTTVFGVGGAVANFVAFTLVGTVALQDPVYGGVSGLFAGLGSYFFLPWFIRFSRASEDSAESASLQASIAATPGSARLAVVGVGLEIGAIMMLVAAFILPEPNPTEGVAVGIAVAVAVTLLGGLIGRRL